ncbi:hypothetical protein AYO28_24495 [Pseudomonas putida]|uniref:Uncharacterized protein n=1 Tax=Pseudomonas putida TaxID=303 RepID=A0A177SH29_PSEPU|nr:hypothetical protein AYO28_24495 [Pseudomonas putida]
MCMDIVERPVTNGASSHGIKNGGTNQVSDLQAGMVVTDAKYGNFFNRGIGVPTAPQFVLLGENRMRNITIACGITKIRNDHSTGFLIDEEMLEALGDVLGGDGVDGSIFQGLPVLLHPNARHQLDAMRLTNAQDTVDEFEMVLHQGVCCRMFADIAAQIRPFDFLEQHVQCMTLTLKQPRVEPALETNELVGDPADALRIYKEPCDDQHGLLVIDVAQDRL